MAQDPRTVTIFGRLSFPTFSHAQAVINNAQSPNPAPSPDKVTAEFNLVLGRTQYDKFMNHVLTQFKPWTMSDDAKVKFTAKDWERIERVFEDLEDQPPYVPLKVVSDKTKELAPEAAGMIRIKGPQGGVDIKQLAIVKDESELAVPDPDQLTFPVVKPIGQTVHDMYPGANVAATLNLYNYLNGKTPGFSASASAAIFKSDNDRFGGGVEVDEDELFMDEDE